ncbi:MAG: T9SS type A sorting domain-containing protein [Chitinophagales bacterium]|nr:T9SS type A sorting domain-containing protein [Chitinophagales bacterium]
MAYSIYPNPASDYLVINGSAIGNKDVVIELRNALGALVLLNPLPGTNVRKQINLDGIPSDLYTLEIKNAGLRPAFFKIQVSK